jgi:hypothetical protein
LAFLSPAISKIVCAAAALCIYKKGKAALGVKAALEGKLIFR